MDIKIVDKFLDTIDLKKVAAATNDTEWTFQRSNVLNKSNGIFLMKNMYDDKFFNTYLFDKIKEHLDGEYKDKDYELQTVYFNGQFPGREGEFHLDVCDVTVLLYVSPYEYGWGGFTEIMTSTKRPTLIHPLQNRLVIFPGRVMHKAYSFSYQTCPPRISLAFKLNTK